VSGDNHVSLISERELHDLVLSELPGVRSQRSRLMDIDPPNYCILYTSGPAPATRPS
jgi:hypothetical protein